MRRRGVIALGALFAAFLVPACGKPVTYSIGPADIPQTLDFQPAWDPADSVIAYTHLTQIISELALGPQQIWLLDLRTGAKRFFASGEDPSWSPDGRALAFVNASGAICVQALDSASPSMATDIGPCLDPSWSPTQAVLTFDTRYNDPTGARAIWTIRTDGTGLTDISTHGTGEWIEPRWSPDGDDIIHCRYLAATQGSELFEMRANGDSAKRLTSDSVQDEDPAISPSGGAIAWTISDPSLGGVWVMDRAGTNRRLVMRDAQTPAWSADGVWLAVSAASARNANQIRIWVVRPDGTGARQLTGL